MDTVYRLSAEEGFKIIGGVISSQLGKKTVESYVVTWVAAKREFEITFKERKEGGHDANSET